MSWTCSACTLLNDYSTTACEACGESRPGSWACAECTLQNDGSAVVCVACGAARAARAPPRQSKRGEVWHSANHLLGFQAATRPKAAPSRNLRPVAQRAFHKGEFVQGACRLVLDGSTEGWDHVQRVDMQCLQEPACPICLEVPSIPRLTQCGHAFCWMCALKHLETSRSCPVCNAELRSCELRPVRFELVKKPELSDRLRFRLVHREGLWVGLPMTRPPQSSLAVEGQPGWLFARRVLGDPAQRLSRLHAECRELEAMPDDRLSCMALAQLRAELAPAAAAASFPDGDGACADGTHCILFYQSEDAQLIFLEPYLTKQLLAKYGRWADLPEEIWLHLQGLRTETLSEDLRQRHRFLAHLRIGEVLFADGRFVEGARDVAQTGEQRAERSVSATSNGWRDYGAEWSSNVAAWSGNWWKADSWSSGWKEREGWEKSAAPSCYGAGHRARRNGAGAKHKNVQSYATASAAAPTSEAAVVQEPSTKGPELYADAWSDDDVT